MAKILFVFYSEIDKGLIFKTYEEQTHYLNSMFNYKEDLDIEIAVEFYKEDLNINEFNPDIIVARGLLALQFKKRYKNIPIVEFPTTLDDVISSIQELQKTNIHNEPIAIVGLEKTKYFAQRASQIYQVPVVPFCFSTIAPSHETISMLIDELILKGFKYIIGGLWTTEIARSKNLTASFLGYGYEALRHAIAEAMHIAQIRRMERERAAHFETVLNSCREGIISTDTKNEIIHINSSAGKILDIDISACIGAPIEKVIPDAQFMSMMHNKNGYSDELIKIKKNDIVLNKVGISLGTEKIGKVVTFQKVRNLQNTEIKIRNSLYRHGLTAKYSFNDILGESTVLKEAIDKAQTFAKVPSNILITGNTGTGKELFSQSIHNYSRKKNGPFVAVNCSAIPENLMESEFFGYAGGAFTGASKEGKPGYFELAHEGTIFLDEVSEIPLNLQGKLLRVIQESEVMRIGHDKIIPINVRIICATNKDLKALAVEEKFRKDLYYRLSVLQLHLPSLCEREQDLLLLANHFINHYASAFLKNNVSLSTEAEKLFLNYSWDGNIRELRNVCEQLVALNATGIISAEEVHAILPDSEVIHSKNYIESEIISANTTSLESLQAEKDSALKQAEKKLIMKALAESNYNKTKAALLLNMSRTTLWKKLKEHNINLESFIRN